MTKKWYVLHTYSGYENKVKKNLETRIETMGLENNVFAIQIPTETVTEIKEGGRRVESDKKVFPGYVLVRMELDDRSWAAVRNTPGVTGFVARFRGYFRDNTVELRQWTRNDLYRLSNLEASGSDLWDKL